MFLLAVLVLAKIASLSSDFPFSAFPSHIFPVGIKIGSICSIEYIHHHFQKCNPGASSSACIPASPLVAIILPIGKSPRSDHFFSTRPDLEAEIKIHPNTVLPSARKNNILAKTQTNNGTEVKIFIDIDPLLIELWITTWMQLCICLMQGVDYAL